MNDEMKRNMEKTWMYTFLATEKVCISMSPEGVTTGTTDWLEEQIKGELSVCRKHFHGNREIVGPGHYLRLMRRALSRPSRSLARISFLFSSSSATFSATVDRLLAFRSRRTAPEYIWVSFNRHIHINPIVCMDFRFIRDSKGTCAHDLAELDQALEGEMGDMRRTPFSGGGV